MVASQLAYSQPWVQWSWVSRHTGLFRHAVGEHLILTGIAVGVGLMISLPLGVSVWRWRWLETPVFGITGALYAIPALALFAFLIPVTGLSRLSAEIALVSYTLLILVRNVVAGLDGVPAEVQDAARGMGLTRSQMLLRVQLPLAVPTIVAGVRIATVTTIGLVAVAGLIGEGGLGTLFNDALPTNFRTEEVVGAALIVGLAVVADAVLLGVQRLMTPWARRGR
ncbi:MAG: ABC transporter permease, partial [Acidimicrobiales bacterium]